MIDKIKRNSDRHYELGDYEATHHSKRKYGSEFNGWIVNHKRDRYDYSDTLKSKKEAMDDMRKRHQDSSKVNEDAPTVNAGSGNIAGIGVGIKGEPGVSPAAQKKRYGKTRTPLLFPDLMKRSEPNNVISNRHKGQFAGAAVFEVNSKLFHNLTLSKRKGKHWRTYLEEDDCYAEIREWAVKHPKSKIVIQNEQTGEMRYIKY